MPRESALFVDRAAAGRLLGDRLRSHVGSEVVVLGLTRGGVPVAFEVAHALGAPLDVIVMARLGVPWRPEVTMGALAEDGSRLIDDAIVESAVVSPGEIEAAEGRERGQLRERVMRLRGGLAPRMLRGRTAVIVDDGLASGVSARVACQVARNRGAGRVVVAVPVASEAGMRALALVADDVVALQILVEFVGIGQAYREFSPTDDDDVACLLLAAAAPEELPTSDAEAGSRQPAAILPPATERTFEVEGVTLAGRMSATTDARELVILAHDSSRQRHWPRSRYLARLINDTGVATLLLDLLTPGEESHGNRYLAVPRLAQRLRTVTRLLRDDFERIDYLADGVAAAIVLEAAADADLDLHAVVALGGRPDLVAHLGAVHAPVLLVVGEQDPAVLRLNAQSVTKLSCPYRLVTIPGAGHSFREPGALQHAAAHLLAWLQGAPTADSVTSPVRARSACSVSREAP